MDNGILTRCLADLEERIDANFEVELEAAWKGFLDGRCEDEFFAPSRPAGRAPGFDWPQVRINDALESPELMALHQLKACSDLLSRGGNGYFMCVRSNFGVSIVPSLFGAKLFIMDAALDSLPNSLPIEGGADGLRRIVERGMPSLDAGQGALVFETGRLFVELFERHPKVKRFVHIYHPDFQGPIDACELLWGSEIFLGLYDEPELLKSLLSLVTETIEAALRRWESIAPAGKPDGYSWHWGFMQKGRIMLRDDSAMNLSPENFREFIMPYDSALLEKFGGGAVHFCGRGDHYIADLSAMPGLRTINMSQPHLNNMETIFANTVDRGISITGLARGAVDAAVKAGRPLHGLVQTSPKL